MIIYPSTKVQFTLTEHGKYKWLHKKPNLPPQIGDYTWECTLIRLFDVFGDDLEIYNKAVIGGINVEESPHVTIKAEVPLPPILKKLKPVHPIPITWNINDAAIDTNKLYRVTALTSEGMPIVTDKTRTNGVLIGDKSWRKAQGRFRWSLFRGWYFKPDPAGHHMYSAEEGWTYITTPHLEKP